MRCRGFTIEYIKGLLIASIAKCVYLCHSKKQKALKNKGSAAASTGRRRGLECGLIGAVEVLQEVLVQAQRADGWGSPRGWILEVIPYPEQISSTCVSAVTRSNLLNMCISGLWIPIFCQKIG
jgi:hypothetical protein